MIFLASFLLLTDKWPLTNSIYYGLKSLVGSSAIVKLRLRSSDFDRSVVFPLNTGFRAGEAGSSKFAHSFIQSAFKMESSNRGCAFGVFDFLMNSSFSSVWVFFLEIWPLLVSFSFLVNSYLFRLGQASFSICVGEFNCECLLRAVSCGEIIMGGMIFFITSFY